MIVNLFSVFDSFRLSIFSNWFFFFFFLWFIIFFKYINNSSSKVIFKSIINLVYKDLTPLIKKNSFLQRMFNSLFLILLVNNFLGLMVYIFSTTSYLSLTLITSIVLWIRIFIVNLIYNIKNFLSHLVPNGISYFLIPLIVLIETLRNLIRPFILGIRIRANIIAGHLLITLVGELLVGVSSAFLVVRGGIRVLVILETMVSVIQAYIFTILLGLYFSE